MTRNRFILKTFSIFCILLMLENLLMPAMVLALTSGPTAPEATSFEPVDTSSMVDALTGDMTYSVPLLEVPGPSGGYPLSLSYHAGIMPNEEASWVGLGWTLNPGSISRSVSGYPDDHNQVAEVDRQVWEGGETSTTQIGVTVPIYGYAMVDANLTVSRDTYRGFSMYESVGVRANTGPFQVDESGNVSGITVSGGGQIGSLGVSAMASYSPSSGLSVSGSAGKGGASISASYSSSAGFSAVGAVDTGGGARISASSSGGQLGITMSSAGNSYSISGLATTKRSINNKAGKISTNTKTSGLDLGVIRYKKRYERYWIDETSDVATYGSLYFPSTKPALGTLANKSFDTYDLPEDKDFDERYPVNELGGSFVDYDNYSVNAQGVGGTMRPYHYYRHLYRQTELDDNDSIKVESYPLNATDQKVQFRFENELANRFDFNAIGNLKSPFLKKSGVDYFDITSADIRTGKTGKDGFIDHRLLGKSPVRYYTNGDINQFRNVEGFLECDAPGFDRSTLGNECDDQVGAFTVTNESGVNYHFSLPAYSFDEYSYSGKEDVAGKDVVNQHKRLTKYAYTWYLTAVTGPDYVDRNTNGKADQGDYGYWVNFRYGKWADDYGWRNPASGVHRDLDEEFGTFSKGKKELYYLNSIATETHTALFIKEIRKDAKGTVSEFDEAVIIDDEKKQERYRDKGGHAAVRRHFPGIDPSIEDEKLKFNRHAVSTLKLNKILLVNNNNVDLTEIETYGDKYDDIFEYSYLDKNGNERTYNDRYHYGNNVLDIHDFNETKESLLTHVVRGIDFETSYILAEGTDNSFDAFAEVEINTLPSFYDVINTPYVKYGKLTLESITFLGERGQGKGLLPPLKFGYDLDTPTKEIELDLSTRKITTSEQLNIGSIYWFNMAPLVSSYYIVITGYDGDGQYDYQFLNIEKEKLPTGLLPGGGKKVLQAQETKNPPYFSDLYDIWGLFKSDYITADNPKGSSFGRRVTALSAKSVDVWSLRKIVTGVGSTITLRYEPDTYKRSVLGGSLLAPLLGVEKKGDHRIEILLPDDISYEDVTGNSGEVNVKIVGVYENPELKTEPRRCSQDQNDQGCEVERGYLSHRLYGSLSKNGTIYHEGSHSIEGEISRGTTLYNITSGELSVGYDGPNDCCRSIDVNNTFIIPGEWPDIIASAMVEVKNQYGGSIRVKDITLSDGLNERRTSYTYEAGATSYEPLGVLYPELSSEYLNAVRLEQKRAEYIAEVVKDYKWMATQKFHKLMGIVRELPGPNVLYDMVQIREQFNEAGQGWVPMKEYKELVFQNYGVDSVGVTRPRDGWYTGWSPEIAEIEYTSHQSRGVVVTDESSKVGLLRTMTLRQGAEEHEIISKTEYDYQSAAQLDSLGVINELFLDARRVRQGGSGEYHLLGTVSKRVTIPWVQHKQTTTDTKTGIVITQENRAYDFYSGQLLEKMTQDSRGNYFLDVGIPAYHQPAYKNGMGPLFEGGKNMLSQSAGEERWKVDENGEKLQLVSASVQTWSDQVGVLREGTQAGIWRKQATYHWDGKQALNADGTYPKTDYENNTFDYANLDANSHWQRTSEITLYSPNSHALEAKDINDQLASTRLDKNDQYVIASAAMAGYHEMTYSGAEQLLANGELEGNVQRGNGELTTLRSHTGRHSLVVPSGGEGFNYT